MSHSRLPGFVSTALFLFLLTACSKDRNKVIAPDSVAPAPVSDLTATALTDTSIQLVWTATGDDGDEGRASRYDIRINLEPFPNGHFPPRPSVGDSLPPAVAGTTQTVTANGLLPSTTYYFAMRVGDEIPNWSPVSNVAGQKTMPSPPPPDIDPPQAITDLDVIGFTPTSVTLTWTSVGDNGTEGFATAYDVRYAAEPISEITWAGANEATGEPTPAPAGRRETLKVEGLTPGAALYFAIKAGDEVPNWSTVSPSLQAMTNIPRIWRIYVDGGGDAPTIQAAMDAALVLDTLIVYPGTYYENSINMNKDLVLRTAEGPEATILDGSLRPEPILRINAGVTPATVIEGFTFTNGSNAAHGGGAITGSSSFPTICRNHFRNNSAGAGGAILLVFDGKPLQARVEANLIEDNEAYWNAGGLGIINNINIRYTMAVIEGNVFRNNRVTRGDGGGFWLLTNRGNVTVTGNTFVQNETGDHGGGLYIGGYYDRFFITRNLVVGNIAHGRGEGDTGSGGGIWLNLINGELRYNTIIGNRGEGESPCSGGGILLDMCGDGLDVSDNIIAGSEGCAISLFRKHRSARLGRNILWNNDGISSAKTYTNDSSHPVPIEEELPEGWTNELLFVDPNFCNESHGDYRVAANSPAIIGGDVMGAFGTPGCGGSLLVKRLHK